MSQSKLKTIKGVHPRYFAVTANLLLTGDVVYLSPTGRWVWDVTHAKQFKTETSAEEAVRECQSLYANQTVGIYLIALDEAGWPLSTKEQLRTKGPTNYHHNNHNGQQLVANRKR